MSKKRRSQRILKLLRKAYTDVVGTALNFSNALELLVATILSAQCTDKRVNKVMRVLFKKYKTAADYAKADVKELQDIIRSTGFYHNKAKFIKSATKKIVEDFNSEIPGSIEEMIKLPGVGRKTANVVLSNAFGIHEGVAVDTHVMRLSKRLGFTEEKDRVKIERDLMKRKKTCRVMDLLKIGSVNIGTVQASHQYPVYYILELAATFIQILGGAVLGIKIIIFYLKI